MIAYGIYVGPSNTANTCGLYCEGYHRTSSCLNYMTHTMQDRYGDFSKFVGLSALLQLMVARNCGGTVNRQWCQERGSVVMTGVYVHSVNVLRALDHNFGGWPRLDKENLCRLRRGADGVGRTSYR